MNSEEADEFRRIQLVSEVERATSLIAQYREASDFYRRRVYRFQKLLGHVAERLGEPEEDENDDH